MGAVAGYRPDRLGGLEIVKWHTGSYAVREVGQDDPVEWCFVHPRKRTAVAARQLLLDAAGGDWADLPHRPDGLLDVGRFDVDLAQRVRRVFQVVRTADARRAYGQCLCCGYAPFACACDRPAESGDPRRWTAEDMAWAR